jgi:hypothetical protein
MFWYCVGKITISICVISPLKCVWKLSDIWERQEQVIMESTWIRGNELLGLAPAICSRDVVFAFDF